MKGLLYLMHLDIRFIKHRAHYLAKYLDEMIDTDVFYLVGYQKKFFDTKSFSFIPQSKGLFRLPKLHSKLFSLLNKYIIKLQIRNITDYKIIWVNYPLLYFYIKDFIKGSQVLIYDCSDDNLAFPQISNRAKIFLHSVEQSLIKRANVIIVSSENLKEKISDRYKINDEKIFIVNNGIYLDDFDLNLKCSFIQSLKTVNPNLKVVTYIGTISNWLDFDLINKSLDLFNNLAYIFIGPSDVAIPSHPMIYNIGVLRHDKLYSFMKCSDCLVMPFKFNNLIESVDPVKIYEYIFAAKPIIALEYKETRKFIDYVYLYKDAFEFLNLIKLLMLNELDLKQPADNYIRFALQNTWSERAKYIYNNILKKYL